ncbi:MAG: cupin domain-containing protein [Nitriliruptoraceae bacterium]|nr:cupin domain-containing protein [Nitriliruptoraceae bacterium]
MATTDLPARAPEVLAPGSGDHLHFLNHLATVKVRAGGDGTMSVVEFLAPRGLGPPLHRHRSEDELFVVLDGELRFHVGNERFVGAAGAIASLPHGIPHTFQVHSPSARFVCVTASRPDAPRFDAMVTALGQPVDRARLPVAGPIDPGVVAEICAAHGIDVLGPPPAPLD